MASNSNCEWCLILRENTDTKIFLRTGPRVYQVNERAHISGQSGIFLKHNIIIATSTRILSQQLTTSSDQAKYAT